jgi:hypothetical protein
MPGTLLWQSGSIQTLGIQASGQGSQLTNGTAAALGTVFDNTGASGGPALYANVEFLASASGYGAALSAGNYLEYYMTPSQDGTTFPDAGSGNILPAGSLKGIFLVVTSGNSQARLNIEGIPLMPVKYKGFIKNVLGQTLTSGWGVSLNSYNGAYT